MLWFYAVAWAQRTFFPIDPAYLHLYKAINNWSVLGVKDDPVKIPLYALLNPWKSLEALTYDAYLKLLYVMLLFGPLLFLPFKSSLSVIMLVWLGPALLSNYRPYYGIFTQYPAYLIPFIFPAAIEGIKKKIQNSQTKNLKEYMKNILILGFISCFFLSPISPLIITLSDFPFAELSVPNITRHEELLQEMIDLVPLNSSILTQNNIFPHFSSRANAYVYPIAPVLQQAPQEIDFYIDGLFEKSEYVLADVVSDSYTANLIISRINETKYGLYAFADGIYLYKLGYEGHPIEISK
jgi:uncharacterized membrane protein